MMVQFNFKFEAEFEIYFLGFHNYYELRNYHIYQKEKQTFIKFHP